MISLVQLLKEVSIPKNKWVPLSGNDIKDLEDDILDLIQNAYGPIGGHPNYKSVGDLAGSDYEIIDLDDDPDLDAVTVTKQRAGGTKHVGIGHDGTSPGKRGAIGRTIDQLDKPSNYIEASGAIENILRKAGVVQVTDEETIRKALKGKEIKIYDDGTYDRILGGKKYRKTMFGKPKV
jgi:hypothetical protein|tara:strand:+ start:334 stop:867 length:534 start_codon:yes stop_codon:yes gene_type:complete